METTAASKRPPAAPSLVPLSPPRGPEHVARGRVTGMFGKSQVSITPSAPRAKAMSRQKDKETRKQRGHRIGHGDAGTRGEATPRLHSPFVAFLHLSVFLFQLPNLLRGQYNFQLRASSFQFPASRTPRPHPVQHQPDHQQPQSAWRSCIRINDRHAVRAAGGRAGVELGGAGVEAGNWKLEARSSKVYCPRSRFGSWKRNTLRQESNKRRMKARRRLSPVPRPRVPVSPCFLVYLSTCLLMALALGAWA